LTVFLFCSGRLEEDGPLLAPRYGTAELDKCHLIINWTPVLSAAIT